MFEYEIEQLKNEYDLIVGVDEVGRGCLAGPVVAGAVVFNFKNLDFNGWAAKVKDSKLLSPVKRAELDSQIRQSALQWGIGQVAAAKIDELNIHLATLSAMHKAVQEVIKKISNNSKILVLVDGRFIVPGLGLDQQAVVDGDNKVFSISAASIVAKVYRDALMVKLGAAFPDYGFAGHKGYGTRQHLVAIETYGLTPQHRKTFCKRFV